MQMIVALVVEVIKEEIYRVRNCILRVSEHVLMTRETILTWFESLIWAGKSQPDREVVLAPSKFIQLGIESRPLSNILQTLR
jgi:hypothetical protein